jgi:SAM-dependent methyltransferase
MDWEQRYRTGDTPWEKGAPAPPLLDWIRERGALNGSILVPGCGNGHDVRALAAAAPAAEVVGLDIAPSAISQARQYPRAGSEVYRLADLFHLPADLADRFDWVFEHTCFCVLEPARRTDYVRAVTGALCGEGSLLAIFFLNPWDPGEAPVEGGPPFGTTREELDALFENDFRLVEEFIPQSAYPGREGREIVRLLRRCTGADEGCGPHAPS